MYTVQYRNKGLSGFSVAGSTGPFLSQRNAILGALALSRLLLVSARDCHGRPGGRHLAGEASSLGLRLGAQSPPNIIMTSYPRADSNLRYASGPAPFITPKQYAPDDRPFFQRSRRRNRYSPSGTSTPRTGFVELVHAPLALPQSERAAVKVLSLPFLCVRKRRTIRSRG